MRLSCARKTAGFTMVELVVVIIMVGILAAVAAPKLLTRDFSQHGFYTGVKNLLQHARRTAMASRRYQCVDVTGGGTVLSLTRDTGVPEGKVAIICSTSLALPVVARGCGSNQLCAPSGVAVTGTSSLIFDPMGRLVSSPGVVAASAATLSIDGEADITVAPETGYVQ